MHYEFLAYILINKNMRIMNYKGICLSVIEEENFYVAYFYYLDYNWDEREVCITRQYLWRETTYIAKYSGLTTQHIWAYKEVLDKVIKQYRAEEIK